MGCGSSVAGQHYKALPEFQIAALDEPRSSGEGFAQQHPSAPSSVPVFGSPWPLPVKLAQPVTAWAGSSAAVEASTLQPSPLPKYHATVLSQQGQGAGLYDATYQWQLKNGAWVDFEDEELHDILLAWRSGRNLYRYAARGFEYEINFQMMRQSNVSTQTVRQMRVKMKEDPAPGILDALGGPVRTKVADWDSFWYLNGECRRLDAGGFDADREASPEPAGAPQSRSGQPWAGAANPASARAPEAAPRAPAAKASNSVPGARQKRFTFAGAPPPARSSRPAWEGEPEASQSAPGQDPPPREDRPTGKAQEAPAGAAAPAADLALPAGVQWPPDLAALRAAQALYAELLAASAQALDARRSAFKAKCLAWHPDKNLTQVGSVPKTSGGWWPADKSKEDLATEVFQFLQALRGWFLQG